MDTRDDYTWLFKRFTGNTLIKIKHCSEKFDEALALSCTKEGFPDSPGASIPSLCE